jgi:arginase family enzyme
MQFYSISLDEGAMDKNKGCAKAPKFLFDLFKVNGKEFSLEGELEEKQEQIFEQAKLIFGNETDSQKVFFGGTHDITGFLVKAFAEKNKDAKLLIFDAHADCEDALSVTTHEDFVRMLIKKKIIAPENLMIIGLRHVSEIEKDFLKENKIKNFYFEDVEGAFESISKIIEGFVRNAENLYVSFDVDVLDSEKMKATGYLPPRGLSQEPASALLEISIPRAKVIDLVEFNPEKITLNEGKLLFELFNKYFK